MKKVIIYAIAGFAAVVALVLIVAALQPNDWRIERSVLIKAPKERIWTIVSDLHRYNDWNSFYLAEPEAKTDAQGPAATVGSSYSWDGAKSGAGTMTITAVAPAERLDFRLDFLRPVQSTSLGSFTLSELEGDTTRMSWAMSGRHEGFVGLMGRAIHLFISMDSMLGSTFETGLNRLKELSEKAEGNPHD